MLSLVKLPIDVITNCHRSKTDAHPQLHDCHDMGPHDGLVYIDALFLVERSLIV